MNRLNVGDYVDVSGLNEAQRRALGQAMVLDGVKEWSHTSVETRVTGFYKDSKYWFVAEGGYFNSCNHVPFKTQRTPEEIMFLNAPAWAKYVCDSARGSYPVWVESVENRCSRCQSLHSRHTGRQLENRTYNSHGWTQSSVLFTRPEQPAKQFTPDDLKDGMRCYHKDGRESIVAGTILIKLGKPNANWDVTDYFNDFSHAIVDLLDIIKVVDRGVVVWERSPEPEQKLELTLEDIAKRYGVPVGQLRIKD